MAHSSTINPKGPRLPIPGSSALAWVDAYLLSSVGQKFIVAVTGLSLAVFALFHMIGNLKMFSGPESINRYAVFLKHDLGALIWIARAGLLGLFLLHLFIALRLKLRAAAARPQPYAQFTPAQASVAARTMIWTGVVIGAFVVFHLLHFTFGMVHEVQSPDGKGVTNYLDLKYRMPDGTQVHDVYAMVVAGFRTSWISFFYLAAQVLLFVHLSHGLQSALVTLGLVGKRFATAAKLLGLAIAGTILAGNTAIVVAIWTGYVK